MRAIGRAKLDTVDKVLEYLDYVIFADLVWFFYFKECYKLGILSYSEFWEAVMELPWLFSIAYILHENNSKLIGL